MTKVSLRGDYCAAESLGQQECKCRAESAENFEKTPFTENFAGAE
jgi:hypothetical protein